MFVVFVVQSTPLDHKLLSILSTRKDWKLVTSALCVKDKGVGFRPTAEKSEISFPNKLLLGLPDFGSIFL